MRRRVVWIVLLAAIGTGAWLVARRRPVAVVTGQVVRGDIRSVVSEDGRAEVLERFVVSAPLSGRLLRVRVMPGDAVELGDHVAEMDPVPLRSSIEEINARMRALQRRIAGVDTKRPKVEEIERARVLEATADEALAIERSELGRMVAEQEHLENEHARFRELARSRTVSPSELELAATKAEQSRQQTRAQEVRVRIRELAITIARLERSVLERRAEDYEWEKDVYREEISALQATLTNLEADLERTRIDAPATGTVLAVYRESEQFVAAGEPILEVGNLEQLRILAEFLSDDAMRMQEGMPAEIHVQDVGGKPRTGRVTRIHPRAFKKISSLGVEQQRVLVEIGFDARGSGLGDGYRVPVGVILEAREDVVVVPESALIRDSEKMYVLRIEHGRARQVEVRTGLRDGRRREVLAGLRPGDHVVLHPGDAVVDGDSVRELQ